MNEAKQRESLLRTSAYRGLLLLVCTIPFQGVVRVPGVGTLSRAVGLGVILFAVAAVAFEERRRRLGDVEMCALAFTAWVAVSLAWSLDPDRTVMQIVTMVQLLVLVLAVREFAGHPARLLAVVRAFVLGAGITCVNLLVQYARYGDETERYTASGSHPNDVAFVLCLAIPLAWYLSYRSTRRAEVFLARVFLPAAAMAIVLTASRSAVLIAFVALAIVPVTLKDSPPQGRAVVALGLAASLLFGPALLPKPQVERLSTISSEVSGGTFNGRTGLWAATLDAFGERPLTGFGAGASRAVIEERVGREAGAHNTFLSLLAELGIVGVTLFALVGLATGLSASRTTGLERKLAVVLGITLLVGLQPRHWEYHKATWLILAILTGLGGIALRTPSADPILMKDRS